MKTHLRLEEAAQFILAFALYSFTGDVWWHFFLWILVPDISMLGYLGGNRTGAICYNIAHSKILGIALFLFGLYYDRDLVLNAGLVIYGHSSLDRALGYGLKYFDHFKHTHLGWIGIIPAKRNVRD